MMGGSALKGLGDALVALFRVAVLSLCALLVLSLYLAMSWYFTPDWQADAIERGFAIHCPSTGDFAWVGECGE